MSYPQPTPPTEPNAFLLLLWFLMVAGAGMAIAAAMSGCVSPVGGGWLIQSNPWTYHDTPIGVGWSDYIEEDRDAVLDAFQAFPCEIFAEDTGDPLIYIDRADIDGNYRHCNSRVQSMGHAAGRAIRCGDEAEIWIDYASTGLDPVSARVLYAHELGHTIGLPHNNQIVGCEVSIMHRSILSWVGSAGQGCDPAQFSADEVGRLAERYCR